VSIWRTELRRGLVELCVLSVLREKEAYGYQIVEQLRRQAELEFTESTVYPVLARLHREKFLAERQERSTSGPPRRYFRLTASGRRRYDEMVHQWQEMSDRIAQLIKKEIDHVDVD
jgi:PadR family transcriptional regulator PadR